MKINSAVKLRKMIDKAIEDSVLTRAELDQITHIATEDGIVNPTEQALLNQLQEMIDNKMLKVVP